MALDPDKIREINRLIEEQNRLISEGAQVSAQDKAELQSITDSLVNNNNLKAEEVEILNRIVALNSRQKVIADDVADNAEKQVESYKQQEQQLKKIDSIMSSMLKRAIDITKNFASMEAQLVKSTNNTGQYLEEIRQVAEEMPGLSFEEARDSQLQLINGMSNFTRLSSMQRKQLQSTTAAMDKLGFSASNSVKLIEATTKSLGMSSNEARNMLGRLKTISNDLNIPMTELDKNFGQVGDKLANFGKQGYEKVFVSLSIAAKNLGIEAGKLLETTEQFTTFEGAAAAAGQLNAVLGGNFVNSINLLNAAMNNPIDAIQQLKGAFDASGKSFGDLSLAQQRYYASILKMDVGEANKLFSQSMGAAVRDYKAKEKSQKELAEASARATDVFNRFKLVIDKIISSPLITWTLKVLETIVALMEGMAQFGVVGETLSFIIGVGLVAAFFKLAAAGPMLGGVFSGLTSVLGRLSSSSTASAAGLAKLGFAAAGIGIGIGAAAAGAGYLASALKEMSSEQIKDLQYTLLGIGIAIIVVGGLAAAFSKALLAGALGVAAFGGALLVLAVGVASVAAAYGLYKNYQTKSIEAEVKLQAERNKTLELMKDFGSVLSNMTLQEQVFENFAEGLTKIASAIDSINGAKLRHLSTIAEKGINFKSNISQIETEMPVKEEVNRQPVQSSTVAKEAIKEVKLTINSPVHIDGMEMGKMVYNGIAIWEESKKKEITPTTFTTKQIKDGF